MAHLIRALAAFLGLLWAGSASAEPISASIAAWWAAASAYTIAMAALTIYSVASSVYGAIQTKKKARAAAQRRAEADAAALADRTTTIISSEAPPVTVYGSPAPIGGSIPAVFASGDKDQYKHFIFIIAAHECEAVDKVFIGGAWVGNIGTGGYADGAEFQLDAGVVGERELAYDLQPFSQETENGTVWSDYGIQVLPVFVGNDVSIVSIVDQAGQPAGSTIHYERGVAGAHWLIGPIGAKGTIKYLAEGPGPALNIQVHLSPGGVDAADAFFRAARPDLWTVDHKLSGYTYLAVTLDLRLERFQGGVPEITVKVRGKKVYDPRTGLTAYSRNVALCTADFLVSEVGYLADFATQIELDTLIASANACDVAVYDQAAVDADPATYGGSRARYTCDGMFRADQDRDATRQQLEDAMAGASLESGGVWRILAGAWSTPVLALDDNDMVAPTSVIQTANTGTAHYNGVRGTYVNAERNGVTEDMVPYQNAVFRAIDERDKCHDITLSFTGNHVRTHQIARVLVEQSRAGFVVEIHPKMFAWSLQPGDRVTLSSTFCQFANKPFRIQSWTYKQGVPLSLQAVEDEESIWDQADEVQADPAPNTSLPSPLLKPGAPLDLVALSGEARMAQQDGVMVVRMLVQWAQSTDRYVLQGGLVRVQWREAVDGAAWETRDLAGDATETYVLGLAVNHVYAIQVQFLSPYAASAWSRISHELHGLEGPPDSVLDLDVRAELTGIYGYWSEPAGIDLFGWDATQLRRGPSWELAEPNILFDGRAKSANLGWFPAGSQAVWAAHHNTIGQWSEPTYATIEILPPGQPLPHAVVNNRNQVSITWLDRKTTQPIDYYEIRLGATWETAQVIGRAPGLNFEVVQPTFGEWYYWVTAVDVAGNRGAPGYAVALTLQSFASEIANLRGKVNTARDEIAAMQMAGDILAFQQLGKAKAGIFEKIQVVVTDASALASRTEALSAEVDANQSLVMTEITTLATEQSAQATALALYAAITGENTAAISDEITARTTADSALATEISTIQSAVGGLSGTVDIQALTLASLSGNVAAQYMIRTEVIGTTGLRAMAGISIGVSSTSGGTFVQSKVAVFANEFGVAADASATSADPPFRVEGGVVYINIAKIKDADIGTLKLAGYAVTVPVSAKSTGAVAIAGGSSSWTTIQTATIVTSGLGPVMVLCNATIMPGTLPEGSGEDGSVRSVSMGVRVLRGSTVIWDGISAPLMDSDSPGAGTWTYSLQACHLEAPLSPGNASARVILLLETKR
ncbi:hypothetical protein BH10PSE18_BH10PSE18_19130 [soil metagenome]